MTRFHLVFLALILCGATYAQSDSIARHYNLDVVHAPEVYREHVATDTSFAFINLKTFIPGIHLDIRYATTNNFVGEALYNKPMAYARKPVAEALKRVQQSLDSMQLQLVIFDAYRPYSITVKFFEIYPDSNFVAHPANGSRHNRGCAVDVTLRDKITGVYLDMPTEFDDFSEAAHPDFSGATDAQKQNRDFLRQVMERNGFAVYPHEWWHFDFKGWEAFPLMDIRFEELEQ
jgi:D-alanyl-D-alanine dipeptidase